MKKVIFLFLLVISFYTSRGQDQHIALIKDTILFTQMVRIRNNIVQASFAFFIINGKYYNGNNFPYGSAFCFNDDTSQLRQSESYFALKKTMDNERNLGKVFKKLNRKISYPIDAKENKALISRFYNCMHDKYLDSSMNNEFYVRSIKFIGNYFFMYCNMEKDNLIPIFCPKILEGDKIPIVLKIDKYLR